MLKPRSFDYHRQHGLGIKVARIFNTYGPRMHPNDGRVGSNFIMQSIRNEPIAIVGDGNQTCSFCYVSDLIDRLVALMASDDGFIGPFNPGNPHEFTMLQHADHVVDLPGSSSTRIFKDRPQDDPQQRRPDVTLAKSELGWEPKVELEQGLEKTIDFFRKLDVN